MSKAIHKSTLLKRVTISSQEDNILLPILALQPSTLQKNSIMSFIELLNKADKELFVLIHSKCTSSFLDIIMLLLRKAEIWIPLYVAMLIWIIRKHSKFAMAFIVCTAVSFAVTDFVSASILKPLFQRPRPCYEQDLQSIMRNILSCGGRFGFPSSHASNHFGLASFWFMAIKLLHNRKWYWLWIWAAIICYAQVYVGKHYPLDVAAGALFGTITGCTMYLVFCKWVFPNKLFPLQKIDRTKYFIGTIRLLRIVGKVKRRGSIDL